MNALMQICLPMHCWISYPNAVTKTTNHICSQKINESAKKERQKLRGIAKDRLQQIAKTGSD